MKNLVLNGKKAKIILLVGLMFMLMIGASMTLVVTRASAETNGKLIFNLINGGTEYDVCVDDKSQTRIVIPLTYKEKPVTKISNNGFASCSKLEIVYLSKNINTIGNNAFFNCKKLEKVVMPNISNIGTNAFGLCSNIIQLSIKDSVENIGPSAFRGLTNKSTLYVEPASKKPNWNENCFAACNATILYETFTPTTLELEEMTRDGIEGYRVIEQSICNPYANIIIENAPDGKPILEIQNYAFAGNEFNKLTVVNSKNSLNIKSNAFLGGFINGINLGTNVTFFDNDSLDEMVDPISKRKLSDGVFAEAEVNSITTQFNHSFIPMDMFSGAINLSSLYLDDTPNSLPKGIQYINDSAFKKCFSISKIYIGSSLIKIKEQAFAEWGTHGNQEIIIDKFNISDEERIQCGEAIITVNSIKVTYETNSPGHEIEAKRVSWKTNDVQFEVPIRTGYTFLGWYDKQGTDTYKDPSGTGEQISDENGNLVPENLIEYRDPTFYAKWEIVNYPITWELYGASVMGDYPLTYNVKSEFTIPQATLYECEFKGWFLDGVDMENEITAFEPNTISGPVTVFAIFSVDIKLDGTGAYDGYENGDIPIPFENYETRKIVGTSFKTPFIIKKGNNAFWTDGDQTVKAQEDYNVTGKSLLKVELVEKTLDECKEGNTYVIYTANQLDEIRNKTDKNTSINVYIDDDITVKNWVPILEFNGVINHYADKTITIESFANNSNSCFINTNYGHLQVVVEANVSNAEGNYAGIIAQRNASSGYLQSCTTKGSINSSAAYTGGAVGCNEGQIMNHTNYANVTATKHVGGIIGYQADGAFCQNLINHGTVSFSCTLGLDNEVGGVIGRDAGISIYSYNYATIKFLGTVPSDFKDYTPYVGGAIGFAESGKNTHYYYKRNGFDKGTLTQNQMEYVQDFSDGTL